MTQRERDRLVALHKADKKLITQKQAARQTGLSERQLRRLLAKLRSEGDQAVVHAARGPRVQPQAQRPGGKTRRGDPLPTRLRRLRADSGSGVSRAAPRRPGRPRNAARLDGRRGPLEAPPQVRAPASVAAPPRLPRRAGAMGHLRARLAGRARREAAADRHDRRCQQRVAGALCSARLERGESPFAQDLSGTKRAALWPSTPTAPACLSTRPKTAPARTPSSCLPRRLGGRSRSWESNRSRPIRRRPKDASSAALAPPRTAW